MILDKIVEFKRREVQEAKERLPLLLLQERCDKKTVPFSSAIRSIDGVSLIAEIKKASPSKGLIRNDFNPAEIAKIYSDSGAAAISVLTDREFFKGSPCYMDEVRQVSVLPLLRKEFIIDPYQIYEARVLGADAVLLIMAVLTDREVLRFREIADSLGMECLIEVHTEEELKRAFSCGASIIGINNRDLHTFVTDIETTLRIRDLITDPNVTVVSESGINTRDDVLRLQKAGIDAMLVGEALMREHDIAGKISELLGK